MQISDMLSQYHRNTVGNSTEELQGASGLQKLVSSVSQLDAGNVFEGTVRAMKNGKVTLALSDGQTITARLDGKVNLSLGTPMFFQVKSNDGTTVAIRPYTGAGSAGNPILMNALTVAGASVNDRNLVMVDQMMQQQLPIDKQSILDMVRIINMNPDVNVATAVEMTKQGIPVSNEMAAQFENYLSDSRAIYQEMDQAMNELTSILGDESLSADTVVRINQEIFSVLDKNQMAFAGQLTEGMTGADKAPGMVSQEMAAGQLASEQTTNIGQTATPEQLANAEQQTVTAGQAIPTEQVANAEQQAVNAGQSTTSEQLANTGQAATPGQLATAEQQSVTAGQAANPEQMLNAEAGRGVEHPKVSDILSNEQLANLTKSLQNVPALVENQTLFPNLEKEDVVVDTMQDDKKLLSLQEKLASDAVREHPELNKDLSIDDFLKAIRQGISENSAFGYAGVQKLFGSKEYQVLLRNVIEQQWLLKPENLKSSEKVNELYERLENQMKQMEEVLKSAGVSKSHFTETATDVRNNIEFMNQLNKIYTYVQLPLKLSRQNANSELYVYTNKKNKNDPEAELTAFLHLDLEHLGSTDVSVKMKQHKVKTNFYLANDESYRLVQKYLPILEETLKKKGYQCAITVTNEAKSVNFADDFLKKDQPSAGILHRYSFDVRT